MAWLQDPKMWSVFVAFLALILSQFPPIRELIKGVRVNINIPEHFLLQHYLGAIQTNLFVEIYNTGGKTITISKLDCFISDMEGKSWHIPGRSYFSRQPPPQQGTTWPEFLLGSIRLKPGESWNENTRCYRLWTESEEEEVNNIVLGIQESIYRKLPSPIFVDAEEKVVEKAKSFFRQKFDLHKGNYKFFIAALSSNNSILVVQGYDFTLF